MAVGVGSRRDVHCVGGSGGEGVSQGHGHDDDDDEGEEASEIDTTASATRPKH